MTSQGRIFITALSLTIVSLVFQNCGQFQTFTQQVVTGSCATDMQPTFQSTYYSFFKKNDCNACHAFASNRNVPVFADGDANAAYNAFLTIGPDKVDSILSVGHNGYSYTTLKPELDTHFENWFEAKESCNSKASAQTAGQTMTFYMDTEHLGRYQVLHDDNDNPINTKQTITFDLSADTFSSPVQGVSLSFDIEVHYDSFLFPKNYEVSNPRITTLNKSIQVTGMTILLNDKSYQITTFTGINEIVPQNSKDLSLDPNGATTFFVKENSELYSNADLWSIQFEIFEETR